jgi:hypothetical protein
MSMNINLFEFSTPPFSTLLAVLKRPDPRSSRKPQQARRQAEWLQ